MDPEHESDDHGLPPADVVVPDDARELDRDVQAYRREVRWEHWRYRCRRAFSPVKHHGVVLPLLAGILVVAAMSTAVLVLAVRSAEQPRESFGTSASPGTNPETDPGRLPDLRVTVAGTAESLRDLRPAVLALAPAHCRCTGARKALIRQSRRYGVPVYLVESGPGAPEREKLAGRLGGAEGPEVLEEPRGVLAERYRVSGLTAILVSRDGTVAAVRRDLRPTSELAGHLAPLVGSPQPGGEPAATSGPGPEGNDPPRVSGSGGGA